MKDLLEQLRHIVGAVHVFDGGDLSAWELDWRRRWRGRRVALAEPGEFLNQAIKKRARGPLSERLEGLLLAVFAVLAFRSFGARQGDLAARLQAALAIGHDLAADLQSLGDDRLVAELEFDVVDHFADVGRAF